MSSQERQREIREQGSRPGETQRQEEAQSAREALERVNAERRASQHVAPDEATPLAEVDEDSPTPRR